LRSLRVWFGTPRWSMQSTWFHLLPLLLACRACALHKSVMD
jgi:hypothetical protein